jgi:hypothetical protein
MAPNHVFWYGYGIHKRNSLCTKMYNLLRILLLTKHTNTTKHMHFYWRNKFCYKLCVNYDLLKFLDYAQVRRYIDML